jgi:16S rRNA G527 N7-methylase RsmG
MLRELKIRNALVLRKRGEELSPEDIENVDLMVSRAVNRKVNLASIAEICVKDRGRLALFSAETDYEQAKSQIAAPRELEAFVPYQLPLDQAKRSVILSAK